MVLWLWGCRCSSEITIFLLHHRDLTNKGNLSHGHWKGQWILLHGQSSIATVQAQVLDSSLFLTAPFLSIMSPYLLEKCFFAHFAHLPRSQKSFWEPKQQVSMFYFKGACIWEEDKGLEVRIINLLRKKLRDAHFRKINVLITGFHWPQTKQHCVA